MSKPRGKTRIIIEKVGRIQTLVGRTKNNVLNDRDDSALGKVLEDLEEAFNLCLDITDMYDPIQPT